MGHRRGLWMIAYDIADPSRLARVYRRLCAIGLPLQYSVFMAALTPKELREVRCGLDLLIDAREDDVRFYPLPPRLERAGLGKQIFPDGVQLLEDGKDLLAR